MGVRNRKREEERRIVCKNLDAKFLLESVDRYLSQYDRVRHCRQEGMSPPQTAYTLNCSLSLVEEYLAVDKEMGPGKTNETGPEK